jgi:hypothetical protein
MKHSVINSEGTTALLVLFLLLISLTSTGQETSKASAPLPEGITEIVSVSCMPCHSSKGGTLSKSKLNFDEWTVYAADKQKKKAARIYKEVKKNKMPPEEARAQYPEIIPTKEQIEIIKSWADSF